MIKKLSKVIIATLLVASSLTAGSSDDSDYQFEINSLVGIEGGYGSFDYTNVAATTTETVKLGHGGIKIGAESNNFRLFLSARDYYALDFDNIGKFDYIRTYGVELQYLMNISKAANIYMGVNGGRLDMKFDDGLITPATIRITDEYIGADFGLNIHLGESADFEIGTRFMSITEENADYDFDEIVTGYASIIFKFKMD